MFLFLLDETVHGAHPKSAITLKNRWMIEQSDLVIVYVERDKGGAYAAMKYAENLDKKRINLYKGEALPPPYWEKGFSKNAH